jgi:superfamily I DNA and RNA helicase
MGVESLFAGFTTVRERNMLFTAMTRAKGLLRMSGIGEPARRFAKEVSRALMEFPDLVFTYPGKARIKQIRKDWGRHDSRKGQAETAIDSLLRDYDPEVLLEMLQKRKKKG